MPGSQFEFVRQAVLPSIRPPGVDQTAQMDLPEEGVASISGTGGGVIDLSFSVSGSWSRSGQQETKRIYDLVRMYYTRPDGTIDYSSYVEVEVLRKVVWANGSQSEFAGASIGEAVEMVEEGISRTRSSDEDE